jgi:hypothetical protein
MNKQISLSALSDERSQVRTKKKEFLAQIERIVPWSRIPIRPLISPPSLRARRRVSALAAWRST